MSRIAVVDTNVVVGSLLTQTSSSPLVTVLDGVAGGLILFRAVAVAAG